MPFVSILSIKNSIEFRVKTVKYLSFMTNFIINPFMWSTTTCPWKRKETLIWTHQISFCKDMSLYLITMMKNSCENYHQIN